MNPAINPPLHREASKRLETHLAAIQRVVAEFYGVNLSALREWNRTQPLASIRQVAMFFCRKSLNVSAQTVAASFSRDDHQTVLHAVTVVTNKIETDPRIRREVEQLRPLIKTALDQLR